MQNLNRASSGISEAIHIIDQQITNKITVLALGGTHLIAILNPRGDLVVGRVLNQEGVLLPLISKGKWGQLPIVKEALEKGKPQAATEVIPVEYLAQVGLDRQAFVPLVETPLAAPEPFDPREGKAGLALAGVHPLYTPDRKILGAALSVYLFNNDFTLVDRIKEVAGIDTVTIFFGDLRIATNVMTEQGKRAVGTRISEAVRNVVLSEGKDYVGRAYVVNEWFITRYGPLRDSRDTVVGSLYVGARESAFLHLVHNFNTRMGVIALVCISLAAVIAFPIARFIPDRSMTWWRRMSALPMGIWTSESLPQAEENWMFWADPSIIWSKPCGGPKKNCSIKKNWLPWDSLPRGSPMRSTTPWEASCCLRIHCIEKPVKKRDGGRISKMIVQETLRCRRSSPIF